MASKRTTDELVTCIDTTPNADIDLSTLITPETPTSDKNSDTATKGSWVWQYFKPIVVMGPLTTFARQASFPVAGIKVFSESPPPLTALPGGLMNILNDGPDAVEVKSIVSRIKGLASFMKHSSQKAESFASITARKHSTRYKKSTAMDRQALIENVLSSQAEILANINRINMVVAKTSIVLLEEDAEEKSAPKHGGSIKGRSANLNRGFEMGYKRLFEDYFSESPVYFQHKPDALGRFGLRPLQKICSAIQMLASGGAADANDEYFRLSESTSLKSLDRFCSAVIAVYSEEYLRSPNEEDMKRILTINEKRGFPGMLGSLDCMHWGWKNCPAAWKGQFQGKEKEATLILEAVVSQDLWFWHSFFGLAGAHNDLNVLAMSPIFTDLYNGVTPKCSFIVNGREYSQSYYLADGIYPDYATIVKTISQPQGLERQHFAKMQEALRKDVERGFGVLQARFAIVAQPARGWNRQKLNRIMKTCIILHNMIVEDERGSLEDFAYESTSTTLVEPARTESVEFSEFLKNCVAVRDTTAHHQLKNDLIKHLWTIKGRGRE
ncbi:hypothetical protein MJO28_011373 [Puccinia striiformis f. sp. tritici]|uniref:Uncharacterized protein n=1 Tax=Puccinia striiformis f. sp. tritici TaxID=168172 RepID=A0ACC0E1Y6_9BASI|nr:hypothetical protein MJO28_011373 [Puccinia striiformis f. sp. tritici]